MAKNLLSEQELLEVINKELTKNWAHKDCYCRVESLKQASSPGRNWEVDICSTGGITLNYFNECDGLRQNVLHEIFAKFDVRWLREQ